MKINLQVSDIRLGSKGSSSSSSSSSSLRHNWLGDKHIIGRLLKPHTIGTIFINFVARNSPFKNSSTLSSTSVFSHKLVSLQIIRYPGGEKWSFTADVRGDVKEILLVFRSLSKTDGGEGVSSKQDRWTERFLLQVRQGNFCDIL